VSLPRSINKSTIFQLSSVFKEYRPNQNESFLALNNVNFKLLEGQFVSLMGPSGSGKSTLICIAGCLDFPTKGSFEFLGEKIESKDWQTRQILRKNFISVIFQHYNLIAHLTAYENIEYPLAIKGIKKAIRKQLISENLDKLGILELSKKKPHELSGGQQQRVSIARALALEPKLLIADEPTAALDNKNANLVINLLRDVAKTGVAVLMGTHDSRMAEQTDEIVNLRDGMIVLQR
jgi:putative ABC transport system ATP-binding protein